MSHAVISGKVVTVPDTDTPSGHNDRATREAHATRPGMNDKASAVFMAEETWHKHVEMQGGYQAYGRSLEAEFGRLTRETSEVRLALVMVGARLFKSDTAAYSFKSGKLNKSKLAEGLGLSSNSRSLVTLVGKGVESVLSADAPIYGDPSPEVVALALSYAETDKAHKAKSAAKGKPVGKADKPSGPMGDADTRDDEEVKAKAPLAVSDLVAALEAAHSIIDGLTDRDGDEWAEVSALVDSLSDKIYD